MFDDQSLGEWTYELNFAIHFSFLALLFQSPFYFMLSKVSLFFVCLIFLTPED